MQRTNIYLEAGQAEALDRRAAAEGVSRSELIRRLVDRALGGDVDDPGADLVAIDESHGALRAAAPWPRGHDDRASHLDAMWRLGT